MITGYNTDVRHRDLVLHVQTEDKGLANPLIESLVYAGGRVLAARRIGYQDLLSSGSGEKEILALMDRQHRTMIAAIRNGKFDDKIDARLAEAQAARGNATMGVTASPASPAPPPETSLDQVILEYLTHEAEQEQLVLLMEEQHGIAVGSHAHLTLRASSSRSGRAAAGTEVTVRMISTAGEPAVLASGETEADGALRLDFDIPTLERGTAALIVSASSDIGRAEIKQLL